MSDGYVVIAVIVVLAAVMARINVKYEDAARAKEAGPDALVEDLWSSFGMPDQGDPSAAQVDALLERVTPNDLATKHAVMVLGIMCARTGHHDVLEPLAQRAMKLDGGCGETAALGVLAAAYAGDVKLAQERHARSQAVMASCASCSASGDARILLQEATLALDALSTGALETRGEAIEVRRVGA